MSKAKRLMLMRGATRSSTSRRKSLIPVWVSLTESPNREDTAARKTRLSSRRRRGKASARLGADDDRGAARSP